MRLWESPYRSHSLQLFDMRIIKDSLLTMIVLKRCFIVVAVLSNSKPKNHCKSQIIFKYIENFHVYLFNETTVITLYSNLNNRI